LAAPALAAEAAPAPAPSEPSVAKLWLLALRAPFLVASLIPAAVGIVLAYVQAGAFDGALAALTLAGAACFQLATNMLNDNFDFRSGNDQAIDHKNPFAGGGRVLTTGRLPLGRHFGVASAFLALGTLIGFAIFFALGGLSTYAGTLLLVIGVLGWGSVVFYVGPPLKFAYRGLGEIVVGTSFGPLVVLGAYLTQARAISPAAVVLAVAMGLLVTAILWINEFPDMKGDLSVGKKTAMARLGPTRSIKVYEGMVWAAFACIPLAVVLGAPPTGLVALLAAPIALKTLKAARANYEDPHALIPANAGTIGLTVLFGILLIAGVGMGLVVRL
jgi:1,4-dihydroxy-2-naphthoate octaprenyltransferase